jgi:hypothetical protein
MSRFDIFGPRRLFPTEKKITKRSLNLPIFENRIDNSSVIEVIGGRLFVAFDFIDDLERLGYLSRLKRPEFTLDPIVTCVQGRVGAEVKKFATGVGYLYRRRLKGPRVTANFSSF